jgi:hypothetical protein
VARSDAHHIGAIAVPQFTMLVHWHTGMMLMRMIIITQSARVVCHVAPHHIGQCAHTNLVHHIGA